VRLAFAAALLGFFAPFGPGCFDGKDAGGLPCREDHQCGLGQRCEDNFCSGAPADTQTDTQADTGTTVQCEPLPQPTWCLDGTPVGTQQVVMTELVRPELTRPFSLAAGNFTGDASIDLVVQSSDTFRLNMLVNEGGEFIVRGTTPDIDGITEAYDIIATDRDCNGSIEFVVLARDGHIAIVNWDETDEQFVSVGQVEVATGAHSFAVGDIVQGDDGYPDLVVSSNSVVSVVTNIDGSFDQQSVAELVMGDTFYQPWDTLILETEDQRIVVPSADGRKQFQEYDQLVHLLRVTQTGDNVGLANAMPPELDDDFRNPWAVAQGDFDGDGENEIAVAERNVNGDGYGTNEVGRLRFYYLETADAFPVFEGGLELGIGPVSLEAADLDCDGYVDLVIGNGGAPLSGELGAPQVFFGSDGLENMTITDVPGVSGGMTPGSRTAVGDFNGDGRPEVAIPDAGDPVDVAGERIVIIGVEGT
jgi:hypothetical protein